MNESTHCTRCVSCPRRLHASEIAAGRYACLPCEARTVEALRAIPSLFRQINTLDGLTKGSTTTVRGSGTREAPVPVRLAILSETSEGGIVTELQVICDAWFVILGFNPGRKLRHDEIGEAVTPLMNNLRWACENYSEIGDDIRTITAIYGRLHGYTTGQRQPRKFTVYCSTEGCSGEMRISLATRTATCRDCDTEYEHSDLRRLDSQYGPNGGERQAA